MLIEVWPGVHSLKKPTAFSARRSVSDLAEELRIVSSVITWMVEADWLTVGHCDEYLSIVPNDRSEDGFTLVRGDPALALKLLVEADRAEIEAIKGKEYKEQLLFLYDYLKGPDKNARRWADYLRDYDPAVGVAKGRRAPRLTETGPMETPERFAKGSAELFIRQNLAIANVIDQNMDRLSKRIDEVNKTDHRNRPIVAFPMLYGRKNNRFLAYLPGVINQLILRKHLLIADPKITLFRNFIRREVGKLGLTPHFIDDTPYHTRWGDVHCATNVFRHPNRYIVRPRYLPTIWAPPAEQTDR